MGQRHRRHGCAGCCRCVELLGGRSAAQQPAKGSHFEALAPLPPPRPPCQPQAARAPSAPPQSMNASGGPRPAPPMPPASTATPATSAAATGGARAGCCWFQRLFACSCSASPAYHCITSSPLTLSFSPLPAGATRAMDAPARPTLLPWSSSRASTGARLRGWRVTPVSTCPGPRPPPVRGLPWLAGGRRPAAAGRQARSAASPKR